MRGGNWSSLLQLVISILNIIWLSWNAMALISQCLSPKVNRKVLFSSLFSPFLSRIFTISSPWKCHHIAADPGAALQLCFFKEAHTGQHCLGWVHTEIPIWHKGGGRDRGREKTGNTVMMNATGTLSVGLQMCTMQKNRIPNSSESTFGVLAE